MDIRIKATNYEITPDVSAYLDKRLATLERFLGDIRLVRCEVEVGRAPATASWDKHLVRRNQHRAAGARARVCPQQRADRERGH